jgi:predicted RNA-binding Zn-ribbon protein involved in translation (DUF1610 family)
MGEYTVFTCPDCGYHSDELRWGVGKDNPRIRFLPAHCSKCASFTEVELTGHDVLVDRFTCSQCEAEVTFFEHIESYECPRCGSHKIKLRQSGYW